ncbi:hypothetical protein IC619_002520 [Hazenella sp. IB182353]|uniref:hypothetical protein n=1 Tax=Polycladospora coralii TaxID=2771432 RepID=UPI0017463E6F|nr:hypothetical protein [Polycladospora coralii]MBS7529370.1 hypothetical protein [Polycladospora coralii]
MKKQLILLGVAVSVITLGCEKEVPVQSTATDPLVAEKPSEIPKKAAIMEEPKEESKEKPVENPKEKIILQMDSTINRYAKSHLIQPIEGGEIYCANQVMGEETKGNGTEVYAWVTCEEVIRKGDTGSGVSVPVVFQVNKQTQIVSHQVPLDGSSYQTSINQMFPADVRSKLSTAKRATQVALEKQLD